MAAMTRRELAQRLLVLSFLAAMPVSASRTSRWWFHTLNSSYSDLGTAIINKNRNSTTGVYLCEPNPPQQMK